jgi:hypothetical protein
MADQIIRDRNNRTIARIKTKGNGRMVIYDRNNHRLGEYDPKSNLTRDKNNRKVGKEGNLLTTLISPF